MGNNKVIISLSVATMLSILAPTASGCTSGLFGSEVCRDGRLLLWKNRDTSEVDNKVEFIEGHDGEYSFVGLFNASDRDCAQAWAGYNEVGFAIMNTASYNIKNDTVSERDMDREGYVMTLALKHCRNVEDFARLLDTLPRPMGVEANFGLFDASGNGAYFETNNDSYRVFDLADQPEGYLVRTNYSHSGRKDEGFGFIREANALHLIEPMAAQSLITPEFLTEEVSRSFYHSLFDEDAFEQNSQGWAIDQDYIPRYKSSAVVVIEGCGPQGGNVTDRDGYVMWVGLGYPPVSEIMAATCSADGVNDDLRGLEENGHSRLSDIARKRRDEVFPFHYGNGDKYIRLDRLKNSEGTGYIQTLTPKNRQAYDRYREINRNGREESKR